MGFLQAVFPRNCWKQSATATGKRQKLLSVLAACMKVSSLRTVQWYQTHVLHESAGLVVSLNLALCYSLRCKMEAFLSWFWSKTFWEGDDKSFPPQVKHELAQMCSTVSVSWRFVHLISRSLKNVLIFLVFLFCVALLLLRGKTEYSQVLSDPSFGKSLLLVLLSSC